MKDVTEDEIRTFIEFDKFLTMFCEKRHRDCENCPLGMLDTDQNLIEFWGCSVIDIPHKLGIFEYD